MWNDKKYLAEEYVTNLNYRFCYIIPSTSVWWKNPYSHQITTYTWALWRSIMHSKLFCLSYKSFVLNNVIVTSFDVWQSSKLLCNCCALIYRGTENIYLYLSIFLPPKFWANCLKTTHYLIFLLSKQNSQAWFKKKIVLIKSRCQFFLPTLWKKSIHLGCMWRNIQHLYCRGNLSCVFPIL